MAYLMTKNSMQIHYRFLFILYIFLSIFSMTEGAGLQFSKEVPQTCLNLFNGEKVTFSNSVTLSFDISLPTNEAFGQIWVYEDSSQPFSFAYIGRDKNSSSFVINGLSDKKNFIEIPILPEEIGNGKWIHVETKLDFQKKTAEVLINNKSYILNNIHIPNPSKANIVFGPNRKSILEVPNMILKNIEIKNNDNPMFFFPLSESKGNKIREKNNKIFGSVENPIWAINKQYYWEKIGSFESSPAAGITFDSTRQQIIIIGDNRIQNFNPDTRQSSDTTQNTCDAQTGYSGEAIYNPVKDETYFYNLADLAGQTRPFFSIIHNDGNTELYYPDFTNPLHHHAYFFNPQDQSLYIFGGYGNYKYANKIFKYDFKENQWRQEIFSGDTLFPRMHTVAGQGPAPDEFFIFGGVGNETGKQELGKDFFYDLYLVNTTHKTIRKLWSTDFGNHFFIPSRRIVFDYNNGYIYILCIDRNTTNLSLHRFNIKNGEHAVVSNEIPLQANCILSSAYLFEDKKNNQLYAVVRQSEDNKPESLISIYSLNTPPVTLEELQAEISESNIQLHWILLAIVIILILLSVIFFRYRARNKEKISIRKEEHSENENEPAQEDFSTGVPELKNEAKTNAVYLLGDFRAFDRKGMEITHRFGPKIKQMFVLFLLYSKEQTEGISTDRLSTFLWPDKTVTSAKNIRGVTINHLRNILTDFKNVELIYEEGKWSIKYPEDFYCDYFEARKITRQISSAEVPDTDSVQRLAQLLQKGSLLPSFVSYDWFDKIKINHDEHFVKIIEKILPVLAERNNARFTIILSDILFSFDRFNETALEYKISSLKKLGKAEYAKAVYERFQEEYKQLYGETYKKNTE